MPIAAGVARAVGKAAGVAKEATFVDKLLESNKFRLSPKIQKKLLLPALGLGIGAGAMASGRSTPDEPGNVAPYGDMDAAHPASLGATGSMVFSMRNRERNR
jgi:hypothetical protein